MITVVTVDPLTNVSCKNYEGNEAARLLKNKHEEVLCWSRAECSGPAEPKPWSVQTGEPKSVRLLNCVKTDQNECAWKLKAKML